jgi:putative transposase
MQSKRHLPHWFPDGRSIFLTWRLCGSISPEQLRRLRANATVPDGKKFVALDAALDSVSHGPTWLSQPAIALCVCDSLHFGSDELQHYQLDSYVVMSNHVHALITPSLLVPRIMNSIKTVTAAAANKILCRTGMRCWQSESFDHWCHDEIEFHNIRRYIENNPVKAGLVAKPDEWPWSSAANRRT